MTSLVSLNCYWIVDSSRILFALSLTSPLFHTCCATHFRFSRWRLAQLILSLRCNSDSFALPSHTSIRLGPLGWKRTTHALLLTLRRVLHVVHVHVLGQDWRCCGLLNKVVLRNWFHSLTIVLLTDDSWVRRIGRSLNKVFTILIGGRLCDCGNALSNSHLLIV